MIICAPSFIADVPEAVNQTTLVTVKGDCGNNVLFYCHIVSTQTKVIIEIFSTAKSCYLAKKHKHFLLPSQANGSPAV